MCEEVTLEIFEDRFMPRMQRFMSKSLAKKLSSTFIWTEIMSVIKGGINRNTHQRFASRKEYQEKGSVWLSKKEKNTLYYVFLQYEEWKMKARLFDFLDVVNHVAGQMELNKQNGYYNYQGFNNHKFAEFLIIDEVQDLYPKTIKLLLSVSKYKVVFAGDTAQTIAKGVSSRISDVRDILA